MAVVPPRISQVVPSVSSFPSGLVVGGVAFLAGEGAPSGDPTGDGVVGAVYARTDTATGLVGLYTWNVTDTAWIAVAAV